MNNLLEYIKKMDNVTYDDKKFNEIDALLYTILTYIDFRGITNKPITIKDAVLSLDEKISLNNKDKFHKQNKDVLIAMSKSKRYENNLLYNYEKIITKDSQFGALTIIVPKHFKYIAFEGTEDDLIGWEENFKMSYLYPIEAQKNATKYLKKAIKLKDIVVYVGGHSKGGNLAVSAAMEQKFLKRLAIVNVFNFDGPGFLPQIVNSSKYKKNITKLRSYYPEEAMVGMIMETSGKKIIIKSTNHLQYQHDPHSWIIDNDKFLEGNLSNISKGFHQKIKALIEKFDSQEREKFVNVFFNLLYKAGFTLKSELDKPNFSRFINTIKEAKNLSKEEKQLLIDVFKVIIQTKNDDK